MLTSISHNHRLQWTLIQKFILKKVLQNVSKHPLKYFCRINRFKKERNEFSSWTKKKKIETTWPTYVLTENELTDMARLRFPVKYETFIKDIEREIEIKRKIAQSSTLIFNDTIMVDDTI